MILFCPAIIRDVSDKPRTIGGVKRIIRRRLLSQPAQAREGSSWRRGWMIIIDKYLFLVVGGLHEVVTHVNKAIMPKRNG